MCLGRGGELRPLLLLEPRPSLPHCTPIAAESLSSLLSPELLEGDNQYHCDYCGGKRDATRQLRVRELPPLLAMSLQRFVFDFTVRATPLQDCCTNPGTATPSTKKMCSVTEAGRPPRKGVTDR